ncbi:MAG: glycoside hydrolase family 53 protein [Gemmatimonadota bacterium]
MRQHVQQGSAGGSGPRPRRPFLRGGVSPRGVLGLMLALACASTPTPPDEDPGPADGDPEEPYTPVFYAPDELVMGADLSYVNQILDHGGTYRDSLGVRSPYAIFADHGTNVARLRLWHDPEWVRTEVYEDTAVPLYSGLVDVALAMERAKAQGMEVNLDVHYSDIWADPGRQDVPAAWRDITDLEVLADSVYRYTRSTLEHLDARGLLPEMVQVGNETNCGMLVTGTAPGFPELDVCEGRWAAQGTVLNAGIRAVRDVAPETRVILHIAQPENVRWWFDGITGAGGVTDFDIIGFSYYSPWSDEPLSSIAGHVADWRQRYGKDVMIMETAYSWTLRNYDSYGNIFGSDSVVEGYPATPEGQRRYLIDLVQQVIDGGGSGVFYWEPAWITSDMKDLWGTGSSWENNTLFDAGGTVHEGMAFYTYPYDLSG